jgi:protein O-mannosyl-transferase
MLSLVALSIIAAYANSFHGAFVFDDYVNIVHESAIERFSTAVSGTTRPILRATYWLNYLVGGRKTVGYHIVNVSLHVLSALVLYGIIRQTLCIGSLGKRYEAVSDPLSMTISMLWGVHPLTTSAVTYTCQRAELLMSIFYLLTMYCAIRGAISSKRIWHVLSVLSCALGMGTKEVMITAPLMVLVYDRIFLEESFRGALARRWGLYVGLCGTWIVLGWLMIVHPSSESSGGYAWHGTSPSSYALTECAVICHYLRLVFWPYPLCLDYSWLVQTFAEVWCLAIAVAGLLACLVALCFRRPGAAFPALWFCIILIPTSSCIPRADSAFEHRMYLPLAGIVSLIVIGGYELLNRRMRGGLMCVPVGLLALGLMAMTHQRNEDYRSEEAIWSRVVEVRHGNLRARNDYAVALSEEGKATQALDQYRTVLSLIPEAVRTRLEAGERMSGGTLLTASYEYQYFRAHANMGLLYYKELGQIDESLHHYAAALRILPSDENIRQKIKETLRKKGVTENDLDGELEHLLRNDEIMRH